MNLYGGPGTGKSTTMAYVFARLKMLGVNCEMAPEYAKEIVWGEKTAIFGDQLYVTAKQHHRLWRLKGKVEVVVTDAPLRMACVYSEDDRICELVHQLCGDLDPSLHVYLARVKPYETAGRTQTEAEARELDRAIFRVLTNCERNGVGRVVQVAADQRGADKVVEKVIAALAQMRASENTPTWVLHGD